MKDTVDTVRDIGILLFGFFCLSVALVLVASGGDRGLWDCLCHYQRVCPGECGSNLVPALSRRSWHDWRVILYDSSTNALATNPVGVCESVLVRTSATWARLWSPERGGTSNSLQRWPCCGETWILTVQNSAYYGDHADTNMVLQCKAGQVLDALSCEDDDFGGCWTGFAWPFAPAVVGTRIDDGVGGDHKLFVFHADSGGTLLAKWDCPTFLCGMAFPWVVVGDDSGWLPWRQIGGGVQTSVVMTANCGGPNWDLCENDCFTPHLPGSPGWGNVACTWVPVYTVTTNPVVWLCYRWRRVL